MNNQGQIAGALAPSEPAGIFELQQRVESEVKATGERLLRILNALIGPRPEAEGKYCTPGSVRGAMEQLVQFANSNNITLLHIEKALGI